MAQLAGGVDRELEREHVLYEHVGELHGDAALHHARPEDLVRPPEPLDVEDHLALVLGKDVEIDVAALSHVTGGHRADEPWAER